MKFDGNNISLSADGEDYLQIENEDFRLSYLSGDSQSNKASSANLFTLTDPDGSSEDRVIKICKTPLSRGRTKKISRFRREIKAFEIASRNSLRNVVQFFKSGEV